MSIPIPQGFLLAGVHCRIKRDPNKPDLSLVTSDVPATAAGVYTTNLVHGAPVALDRERTPGDRIRTVVMNSGVSNACTGERGMRDAREMARLAAVACGADEDQVLVMSTGIIGEFLPMDKIEQGIAAAAEKLGRDEPSLIAAARGIMTTDTTHKLAGRTITIGGKEVRIAGMAKGAAMIGPNMATMLGLVMTDAALTPDVAQKLLKEAVDESFNCISVEGHTSTSDTVLLVANGRSGAEVPAGDDLIALRKALGEVCIELARAIPADGEGATHLISIEIAGCADRRGALQIAKTVADSALVKTAVAGADPNWGRIVSAAGYAGVPFDPAKVNLHLNGFLLYRDGAPVEFDAGAVSESVRSQRDTSIRLELGEGDAGLLGVTLVRFWTTDLTAEYVRLNADYHT
ncbi:MAG: bifunctional glutamate N-acetyltransferase/amino-acid acetyltransferase ArgJ [Candidatus Nealsonbacteria bacterium]|nr:bifunctional glutamate N-acetyltransferase/amino-acid acetyltransferase ArgJ [Candidatus Nealsonbacteria bacterium]